MEPTEVLSKEHHNILQVLEIFDKAKEELEKGNRPDHALFEKGLTFFRLFADRFHHFKEEYLMFGILAQKQEGAFDLEIGALRFQHDRCRHHRLSLLVKNMTNFLFVLEVTKSLFANYA